MKQSKNCEKLQGKKKSTEDALKAFDQYVDSGALINLMPFVGGIYGAIEQVQIMKETGVTVGGVAMLTLNVAFVFWDAQIVVQFVVKSGAKMIGRDIGTALAAGGKTAQEAEKGMLAKVVTETDAKTVNKLFTLTKTTKFGSWNAVADGIAKMAGEKEVTKKEILAFIDANQGLLKKSLKTKTAEMLWKDFDIIGKAKFETAMAKELGKELVERTDFKLMKQMGELLKKEKLLPAERKAAIDVIFQTLMVFDKKGTSCIA